MTTETNINYIDWFRSSSQYINAHRNKIFVVSISGEAVADENFGNIVCDLSLLHSLGVKLVLVHGARPQISTALEAARIDSDYHRGLRITTEESMPAIKQVVGSLSTDIEAMFTMGLFNTPMHGADIQLCRGNFVIAKPVGIHDGVDYHYTGKVRRIQSSAIHQQLDQNNLVLLSNLGYSLTGEIFNISAEEVATEAAIALKADKLILFVPGQGLVDSDGNVIKSLSEEDARFYIENYSDDASNSDLCVKHALEAACRAYQNNVHRSHLISFSNNAALLQELFTRDGEGTLVSSDNFEQLRDATIDDVSGIISLLQPLEHSGTLVTRSRELLETEIANFKVMELEGTIIACAALYQHEQNCGEIAAIVSHPEYQSNGLGERLLRSLEITACDLGLTRLFALTTVAGHWFIEKGFKETTLEELPPSKQQLYNFQRNSKVFVKNL